MGDGVVGGGAADIGSSIGTGAGSSPRHCRMKMASQTTARKRIVAVMALIMALIRGLLLLYNATGSPCKV